MSRWIDLFIDAPVEIDALAEELLRLSGVRFFANPEGTRYAARHEGVVVELSEHRFLDDRHLPLSQYRYDVATRVASVSILDSAEAQLLRHLQAQVRAKGHPALLVVDLQYAIAEADHRYQNDRAEVGP
jgi:hypothetical protein